MASTQLLDVKSDADYVALRRRMSRLRVQNSQSTGGDDDDDDLSDEMLRDLIKYWKKNNTDIAKRFIQTRKERKAKRKEAHLVPGTSGRRKSVEFEDLDMTKTGLRLKTHEPLFSNKPFTRVAEAPECTGSDETLSVRRPKKSVNQQQMNMIINRVSTKRVMSKAEEQIIKSKLDSVSKSPVTLHRTLSSNSDIRPRTGSGSSNDFRKRLDSDGFRQRSQSGSSKDMKKITGTHTSHQRLSSSKSPPENRKQRSTKSRTTTSESKTSHQRLSASKSPTGNRRQHPIENSESIPVIT